MDRNINLSRIEEHYLFSSIRQKIQKFQQDQPDVSIVDLSIGNTTQPLDGSVVHAFTQSINKLSNPKTYSGYGPELGLPMLREHIAHVLYQDNVSPKEVFISDGAKTDIFRLLSLFGPGKTVAIQDPSYPVYSDAAYLTGARKVIKLPCTKQTNFFPQIPSEESIDIFCLCSPNNPTGTVLTKEQLSTLVNYANNQGSIILFDAAYSAFISNSSLPKSIFEIPGARSCAIEVNSFSKSLGFSGVRLGWNVVPEQLTYANGYEIIRDWQRFLCTTFNGASLPVQEAAMAGLSLFPNIEALSHYQKNSAILSQALQKSGFLVHGGQHSLYLWVEIPNDIPDEDIFDFFLHQYHIAITPGIGFGECGKGYVRFSALGKREDILLACKRLNQSPVCASTVLSL